MEAKPVWLIAPVGTCARLVRTQKIVAVLRSIGLTVVHLAWEREEGDDAPMEGVERRVVLTGGGYQTGGLGKLYLKYARACSRELATAPQGTGVYALGLFGALAVLLAPRSRRLNLLFDHNDNISLSMPLPAPVKRVVEWVEARAIRRANIHLIPGEFRWPRADANRRIVPNVPSRAVLDSALNLAKERGYARPEKFTLYANGWLAPTRGMASLAAAMKLLEPGLIHVLLAGRIEAEDAGLQELMSRPDVEFIGSVGNDEALALYLRSHAALTFYDPALEINRLAEPNKWGDCIATATPFIVNSEVRTAEPFLDQQASFAVPYADAEAFAALLRELAAHPNRAIQAGERLAANAALPWDEQMSATITHWLDKLGQE
jgi:glycosyltransferase involved in cell wall biosynthesis